METIEVARIVGVAPGTLRVWERRGLIKPVKKDARGWRCWDERAVAECRKLLAKLHGHGN